MKVTGGDGLPEWASAFLGGGSSGQGWDNMQAMSNFMGGPQVEMPGQSPGTIGGVDIPPADMADPFGGNPWSIQSRLRELSGGDFSNAWATSGGFGGVGTMPPVGTPGWLQGPTAIPTTFNTQGYPYAVPVGPEYRQVGSLHIPMKKPS